MKTVLSHAETLGFSFLFSFGSAAKVHVPGASERVTNAFKMGFWCTSC